MTAFRLISHFLDLQDVNKSSFTSTAVYLKYDPVTGKIVGTSEGGIPSTIQNGSSSFGWVNSSTVTANSGSTNTTLRIAAIGNARLLLDGGISNEPDIAWSRNGIIDWSAFDNGGNLTFYNAITNRYVLQLKPSSNVGINVNPLAQFHVANSNSAQPVVRLDMSAGQISNGFELRDSSGNIAASIAPNGLTSAYAIFLNRSRGTLFDYPDIAGLSGLTLRSSPNTGAQMRLNDNGTAQFSGKVGIGMAPGNPTVSIVTGYTNSFDPDTTGTFRLQAREFGVTGTPTLTFGFNGVGQFVQNYISSDYWGASPTPLALQPNQGLVSFGGPALLKADAQATGSRARLGFGVFGNGYGDTTLASVDGLHDGTAWYDGMGLVFNTTRGSSGWGTLTERMRLTGDGNLSLGSIISQAKLYVVASNPDISSFLIDMAPGQAGNGFTLRDNSQNVKASISANGTTKITNEGYDIQVGANANSGGFIGSTLANAFMQFGGSKRIYFGSTKDGGENGTISLGRSDIQLDEIHAKSFYSNGSIVSPSSISNGPGSINIGSDGVATLINESGSYIQKFAFKDGNYSLRHDESVGMILTAYGGASLGVWNGSGNVSIGSSLFAPQAQLHVKNSNASQAVLRLDMASGQGASPLEINDSSGNTKAYIRNDGLYSSSVGFVVDNSILTSSELTFHNSDSGIQFSRYGGIVDSRIMSGGAGKIAFRVEPWYSSGQLTWLQAKGIQNQDSSGSISIDTDGVINVTRTTNSINHGDIANFSINSINHPSENFGLGIAAYYDGRGDLGSSKYIEINANNKNALFWNNAQNTYFRNSVYNTILSLQDNGVGIGLAVPQAQAHIVNLQDQVGLRIDNSAGQSQYSIVVNDSSGNEKLSVWPDGRVVSQSYFASVGRMYAGQEVYASAFAINGLGNVINSTGKWVGTPLTSISNAGGYVSVDNSGVSHASSENGVFYIHGGQNGAAQIWLDGSYITRYANDVYFQQSVGGSYFFRPSSGGDMMFTANGNLGINQSTVVAQLQVTNSTASQPVIRADMAPGQTANVFETRDSSGNIKTSISKEGFINTSGGMLIPKNYYISWGDANQQIGIEDIPYWMMKPNVMTFKSYAGGFVFRDTETNTNAAEIDASTGVISAKQFVSNGVELSPSSISNGAGTVRVQGNGNVVIQNSGVTLLTGETNVGGIGFAGGSVMGAFGGNYNFLYVPTLLGTTAGFTGALNPDGTAKFGAWGATEAQLGVINTVSTRPAIRVDLAPGQTGNSLTINDSSGNSKASISANGSIAGTQLEVSDHVYASNYISSAIVQATDHFVTQGYISSTGDILTSSNIILNPGANQYSLTRNTDTGTLDFNGTQGFNVVGYDFNGPLTVRSSGGARLELYDTTFGDVLKYGEISNSNGDLKVFCHRTTSNIGSILFGTGGQTKAILDLSGRFGINVPYNTISAKLQVINDNASQPVISLQSAPGQTSVGLELKDSSGNFQFGIGGSDGINHYGIRSIATQGWSNETHIAAYFESNAGSTYNYSLKTGLGLVSFGGQVNLNGNEIINGGNVKFAGVRGTTGNLIVGDTTAFGGGQIVFAGDYFNAGTTLPMASIRGFKENNAYLNGLGALSFGTQTDNTTGDHQTTLATVQDWMWLRSDGVLNFKNTTNTDSNVYAPKFGDISLWASGGYLTTSKFSVNYLHANDITMGGNGDSISPSASSGFMDFQVYNGSAQRFGALDGTPSMRIQPTGVTIGSYAIPTSQLDIRNISSSRIGLKVIMASGQSENILQIEDASGNIYSSIDASGLTSLTRTSVQNNGVKDVLSLHHNPGLGQSGCGTGVAFYGPDGNYTKTLYGRMSVATSNISGSSINCGYIFGVNSTSGIRDVFRITDGAIQMRNFATDGWGTVGLRATNNGQDLNIDANALAFFNASPVSKPTVIGSRTDGTALASLLSALSSLGLITDSTTS